MRCRRHWTYAAVPAVEPYREQIETVNRQIGVIPPRETLKDASGASMMDPNTQITRLHGVSVLDLATRPYEDNLVLAVTREYPDATGRALANVALNACVNLHGTPMLTATFAAREAGNSPKTALCAALAMMGPKGMQGARDAVDALLALLRESGLADPADTGFVVEALAARADADQRAALTVGEPQSMAEGMLAGALARGVDGSACLSLLRAIAERDGRHPSVDAVLAAICCHLA